MPLHEFWHGDMRLLEVYQKAYMRNVSYNAWLNGAYQFEAVSKAIYNGFGRTNSGTPAQQYSEWKNPIPEKAREITEENIEYEFRREQASQNEWLRNLLRK